MPSYLDLTGTRFGQLLVVRRDAKTPSNNWRWWCRCDCGREKSVAGGELRKGSTISCGCHRIKASADASRKHGHATKNPSPEYRAWAAMKHRCYRPQNRAYKNYGGRGIRVCKAWRDSFEQFLADVGKRPSYRHSIDRIDNDGHYEPNNVRWAEMVAQQRNRRSNRVVTYKGHSLTVTEWSERMGMHKRTLLTRLRKGWPVAAAIETPIDTRHSTHHSRLKKAKDPKHSALV